MKHCLYLFLLCISISAAAQLPGGGLVAYYPFNKNALDESGKQNNGLVNGAVAPSDDRFGNPCGALRFIGSGGYISVPNSASLKAPVSSLTITAWIRPEKGINSSNDINLIVLSKPDVQNGNDAKAHYCFQLKRNFGDSYSTISLSNDFSFQDKQYNSHPLEFNRWYFMAITYDDNFVQVYQDGKVIAQAVKSKPFSANDFALEIGRNMSDSKKYFNGSLDDLRIYSRGLSGVEINALYADSSGKAVKEEITVDFPKSVSTNTEPGTCGAKVFYTEPNVSMGCGSVVMKQLTGSPAGSYFSLGRHNLVYEAAVGDKKLVDSFQINVLDNELPVFKCPTDIIAEARANTTGVEVSYPGLSVTDNCPNLRLELMQGLPTGTVFPVGVTTLKYQATDASGNKSNCSFKVTVTQQTAAPVKEAAKVQTDERAGEERKSPSAVYEPELLILPVAKSKEEVIKETAERALAEKERLAKELAEKERIEKEKAEAAAKSKDEADKARAEKEKRDAEAIQKIRAARESEERLAKENAEKERLEKEKAEAAVKAKEEADKARIAMEKRAAEDAEKIRAAKEKEERLARERAEKERLEKEKAEAVVKAKEEADKARLALEKKAAEDAEKIRAAKEKEEQLAKEKSAADALAKEMAERERLTKLLAEKELLDKAKDEAIAKAKAEAEKERLAKEQAVAEKERLERAMAEKAEPDKPKADVVKEHPSKNNGTVKDMSPSLFICRADTTILLPPNRRGLVYHYKPPVAKDNARLDSMVMIAGAKDGCFLELGVHPFIFRAYAHEGNTQTCTYSVIVKEDAAALPYAPPKMLDAQLQLGGDSVHYEHKATLNNCELTVLIYDDGEQDNDSVSIIFNDEVIVNRDMIRIKENGAIQRHLSLLPDAENYIIAKAWNTGRYGLNTLRIDVYDATAEGDKKDLKLKKPILTKILHSKPGDAGGILLKCN